MIHGLLFVLTLFAALGCGLAAGVFFAFSAFEWTARNHVRAATSLAAAASLTVALCQ